MTGTQWDGKTEWEMAMSETPYAPLGSASDSASDREESLAEERAREPAHFARVGAVIAVVVALWFAVTMIALFG